MKIIDLLNRIANEEELPKKIKYGSKIWEYEEASDDYKSGNLYLFEDLFDCTKTSDFINDYIEIFEEPKKIEKIPLPSFDEFKKMSAEERYVITAKEYDLLNELIDEINNLKEK